MFSYFPFPFPYPSPSPPKKPEFEEKGYLSP
jgi:hypothetical protein